MFWSFLKDIEVKQKVAKYTIDLKYLQLQRITTSKQTNPLNSYLILFMFAKTYWK